MEGVFFGKKKSDLKELCHLNTQTILSPTVYTILDLKDKESHNKALWILNKRADITKQDICSINL